MGRIVDACRLVVYIGCVLSAEAAAWQTVTCASEVEWRKAYPLERASERGTAVLSVANPAVRVGGALDLELTVTCDAGALRLFNPFFDPKLPFPARIVVFDHKKRYYGDLLAPRGDTTAVREATLRDWVLVSGLCSAGVHFRFRMDDSQRLIESVRGTGLRLPVGRYFVQAIYSHRAVEGEPAGTNGRRTHWQAKRWNDPRIDAEKFRSTIVEIQISGEASASSAPAQSAQDGAASLSDRELTVQSDLNEGLRRGRATISMKSLRLAQGASAALKVRFENTSENTYEVFNPFFNRLLGEPAALAIFDRDKRHIGDLLCFEAGSVASAEARAWKILPGGAVCEAILPIFGGHVPCTIFTSKERRLPPGEYYLQMMFRPCFATSAPEDPVIWPCFPRKRSVDDIAGGAEPARPAGARSPHEVLFRSNILEIELVGESPDPPL